MTTLISHLVVDNTKIMTQCGKFLRRRIGDLACARRVTPRAPFFVFFVVVGVECWGAGCCGRWGVDPPCLE